MSDKSQEQGKFESLLGRLQFSIANEVDPQAHKDVIGDLCRHGHPDTLKCLQAYAEKTLTDDPSARAEMWQQVYDESSKDSILQVRAVENYAAQIFFFETPSERTAMWAWVDDRSELGNEMRAQLLDSGTVLQLHEDASSPSLSADEFIQSLDI